MELGYLLTRSGLTYPEASSKVCHDSFCQLGNSISLPWVIYYGAFYLHVVSSFSCIAVICLKLVLFLIPLQFVHLFLVIPLLISLLYRKRFQIVTPSRVSDQNSACLFHTFLECCMPLLHTSTSPYPPHQPANPNYNSLACIQEILCESLKSEFWRFHGSEWSDFPHVKDPVIEVTFYVIDPCLTPSIIISFLFFLVTICRLIMGFNRNTFGAQHKNSIFLSFCSLRVDWLWVLFKLRDRKRLILHAARTRNWSLKFKSYKARTFSFMEQIPHRRIVCSHRDNFALQIT